MWTVSSTGSDVTAKGGPSGTSKRNYEQTRGSKVTARCRFDTAIAIVRLYGEGSKILLFVGRRLTADFGPPAPAQKMFSLMVSKRIPPKMQITMPQTTKFSESCLPWVTAQRINLVNFGGLGGLNLVGKDARDRNRQQQQEQQQQQ